MDKNILLANIHSRKVVYLSSTEAGKKHDKKIADDNHITYPSGTTLGKDTGFQGYEPKGVLTFQPKKNQKAKADKWLNGIIAVARVVVENTIAGVKRCRIVKDILRNTKEGFSDLVMEVACALLIPDNVYYNHKTALGKNDVTQNQSRVASDTVLSAAVQ